MYDEYELYGGSEESAPDAETLKRWFANVNTPEELAEAEAWARAGGMGGVGGILRGAAAGFGTGDLNGKHAS